MQENIRLIDFLRKISKCNGDEAIELVSKFQNSELTIEGLGVYDFDETYQYREIGESGWSNCSKTWFDYCEKSSLYDTRTVDT